jgi:hypothetical protein
VVAGGSPGRAFGGLVVVTANLLMNLVGTSSLVFVTNLSNQTDRSR